MPRVEKKKTTSKTIAKFKPILYEAAAPSPLAERTQPPADSAVRPKWKSGTMLFQATLLLFMTGVAGYFYYQYRNTPEISERREIELLVKGMSRIVELPANEAPTLATVTNKEKLDNQPFFKRAENGDKILIYRVAGRAFLYRPATEKLIDITTVNIEMEQPSATPIPDNAPIPVAPPSGETTTPVPVAISETEPAEAPTIGTIAPKPIRLALYNGSATIGVTTKLEDRLKGQFPDIEVVLKEKAAKNSYEGYQVVDLTGSNEEAARTLAEYLDGVIITLPAEESVGPEEIDILVIIGNEK